jgi:RimJ/RimL family protein N-acetyltransferase
MKLDCESTIILENEFVRLSPLALEHFDALSKIALNEKDLLRYSPSKIDTEADLKNYIVMALDERAKSTRYAFVIFDKRQKAIAGSTSFGTISNYDERVEIGWTWIGKQFQGTGLNRQMKFLMLQYMFETLEFERVEFRTDERNEVSRNAIVKIGAKFEGVLRNQIRMNDGYRRSSVYFSILKNEWPEIKKTIFEK